MIILYIGQILTPKSSMYVCKLWKKGDGWKEFGQKYHLSNGEFQVLGG